MRTAVFAIGILIILEGILLLLKPIVYTKLTAFFAKGRLMYIAALLKLAFGVFLLVAATSCQQKLIMIILGLIAAGSGVTMMGMPKEKIKKMFQWWALRSNITIRIIAILAIAIGSLIVYAAGLPK